MNVRLITALKKNASRNHENWTWHLKKTSKPDLESSRPSDTVLGLGIQVPGLGLRPDVLGIGLGLGSKVIGLVLDSKSDQNQSLTFGKIIQETLPRLRIFWKTASGVSSLKGGIPVRNS